MEIVLQWLDDLDDLVFIGLAFGKRLLFSVIAASLLLAGLLNGLFWSPFA